MRRFYTTAVTAALLCVSSCHSSAGRSSEEPQTLDTHRLPTGVTLDGAGRSSEIGSFPLALVLAPGGDRVVALLNGHRQQGIQVIDIASGRVLQTISQPAAFLGLVFNHAGHHLYASGGDGDVIYRYDWQAGAATLKDSLILATRAPKAHGTRYPAGVAISADDRFLYVAENLADSLAVLDLQSGAVVQRVAAGRYPYGVAAGPDGTVYVSAWGGYEVRAFRQRDNRLLAATTITVGRHPSEILLNANGSRLFVASASTDRVAVLDLPQARMMTQLVDTVPGTGEGSTPNAMTLSPDGGLLYIAEADNNAIAIFDLSAETAGVKSTGSSSDRLIGRIPVEWYPTAVLLNHDTLIVANAKGRGTGPNPEGPNPGIKSRDPRGYTLDQTSGTLSVLPLMGLDAQALAKLSDRVKKANGWDKRSSGGGWPPFEHVIYLLKENRTYDQILGDLPQADGDTALLYFPRVVTPNHHALAERFGIFDRFFVNAEVSADGHNWSMAAYATDYTQKTLPQVYSGRGRSYDFEGENRDEPTDDDAAEPAMGYLWDLAKRKNLSFRNFGEFVIEEGKREGPVPSWYRGLKPFLVANTDSGFPGFDMDVPDTVRADLWLETLAGWERSGDMPALQILRLPNDHTSGAKAGSPTPRAYLADNDLALGRVIEGLSRSRFWKNTVVFVLEDDAQDGPDHVDSHRSPFLLISAYNRAHVWHRFTNTTDVLATIESMLSLSHLSQFDTYARPLSGVFEQEPDTTPYVALVPGVSRTELNPPKGPGATESSRFDFRFEDMADDDSFNRVLWLAIKGDRPYPGPTRMTAAGSRPSASSDR